LSDTYLRKVPIWNEIACLINEEFGSSVTWRKTRDQWKYHHAECRAYVEHQKRTDGTFKREPTFFKEVYEITSGGRTADPGSDGTQPTDPGEPLQPSLAPHEEAELNFVPESESLPDSTLPITAQFATFSSGEKQNRSDECDMEDDFLAEDDDYTDLQSLYDKTLMYIEDSSHKKSLLEQRAREVLVCLRLGEAAGDTEQNLEERENVVGDQ